MFGPADADAYLGGQDPAERVEAAHATAEALIRHGRSGDDAVTARLVSLADEHGIDEVALLWADRPADSLPGALWRLYALRAGIRRQSELIARAFDAGRHRAPVYEAVAGVGDPPGPAEVRAVADAVLAGAFTGDLGVALERAAAFCRVVSTGWALLADELVDVHSSDGHAADGHPADGHAADAYAADGRLGPADLSVTVCGDRTDSGAEARHEDRSGRSTDGAALLTRRASDLLRTGAQLETAARRWREGTLH
jgi:hypothetical protein